MNIGASRNAYRVLALIIFFSLLLTSAADEQGNHQLVWYNISQPFTRGALCNDFTTAGYFIRKDSTQNFLEPESDIGSGFEDGMLDDVKSKWVIFLEGGGGCTTPISCNERFIDHEIRNEFRIFQNGTGKIDVAKAWNEYKDEPLKITSKLMTTLWRFSPYEAGGKYEYSGASNTKRASSSWAIDGRNILSTSPEKNPDFFQHHHVLVPYCSSDLWLKKTNNYRKAHFSNFSFEFRPDFTEEHQFTFRGAAIFQSVIEDLFDFHGFGQATQVVLAGSSAGGVGAMNHARWLLGQLQIRGEQPQGKHGRLHVLLDSSWFIDFRGEIANQFALDDINDLVEREEIVDTCSPVGHGHPNGSMRVGGKRTRGELKDESSSIACLSAPLLLSSGRFPVDVPILAIFSRYDLYLLIRSLASTTSTGEVCIVHFYLTQYNIFFLVSFITF